MKKKVKEYIYTVEEIQCMSPNGIYISGPITGVEGYNKSSFDKAEKTILRIFGDLASNIKNPHKNFGGRTDLDWETYMRLDLSMLGKCDMICMLPNWKDSRGARVEHVIAQALGMNIFYFDEEIASLFRFDPLEDSAEEKQERSILLEAHDIINGARRNDYGHPTIQFGRLASLWGTILSCNVSKLQVGLMLVALKMSRMMNKYTRDSALDGAGYFGCIDMVEQADRLAESSKFKE